MTSIGKNIIAAIRIRPESIENLSKGLVADTEKNSIDIAVAQNKYSFVFDKVFDSLSTQNDIFYGSKSIIDSAIFGQNGTIL